MNGFNKTFAIWIMFFGVFGTTLAATSVTSTVTTSSPTFFAENSNVLGDSCYMSAGDHRYEAITFTALSDANHSATTTALSGMGDDNFLAFYEGVFDPQNITNGLVGCNDDAIDRWAAFTTSSALQSGATYTAVFTSYNSVTPDVTESTGTGTFEISPDVELTFIVGGTLSGLESGKSITLQNNGGSSVNISDNGNFVFPAALSDGSDYNVTIFTQPDGQTCTLENASGTISNSNVNNITLICTNTPPTITSTPVTSVTQDDSYSYTLGATDVDGGSLTWATKNGTTLPSWLNLSSSYDFSLVFSDSAESLALSAIRIVKDSQGNLLMSDGRDRIMKVDTSGNISTLDASMTDPRGMTIDENDNLYVAAMNDKAIKKVAPDGTVTTVVSAFDIGTSDKPYGIARKSDGTLYVSLQYSYYDGTVIRVDPDGTQTTLKTYAGSDYPGDMVLDDSGNLYVVLNGTHWIDKIAPDGTSSAYAGIRNSSGNVDGDSTTARFNRPSDIAIDSAGNIYVADTYNNAIRKIDTNQNVTTLEYTKTVPAGRGDIIVNSPIGLYLDGNGDIYSIANSTSSNEIYKFGNATTLSGDATSSDIGTHDVNLTVTDGTNTVEQNFQITVVGVTPTITSTPITEVDVESLYSYELNATDPQDDPLTWGVKTGTSLPNWLSLNGSVLSGTPTVSDAGIHDVNITVHDGSHMTEQNFQITVSLIAPEVTSTPVTSVDEESAYSYSLTATDPQGDTLSWSVKDGTTLPSWLGLNTTTPSPLSTLVSSGLVSPMGVAVDSDGNVYIADTMDNTIKKRATDGTVTTLIDSGLNEPNDVAVDSDGNVYIADTRNHAIKKRATDGTVTTLIDSGLYNPYGVAVDSDGNVYIADTNNGAIKKRDTAGTVTTLVSSGLNTAKGVAVDSDGNVYIADGGNNAIKKIDTAGNVTTLVVNLNNPTAVAVDNDGNVYIADTSNSLIRKRDTDGNLTTLVYYDIQQPNGIAVDSDGNVFMSELGQRTIRKWSEPIPVTKLTGTPTNDDVGAYDVNLTVSDGDNNVSHNFTITVNNVNDIPISADASFTINEDTNKTFAANDFNFIDDDAIHGDVLDSIFITALPSAGTLQVNDVNVTVDQQISAVEIGNLKFIPDANANGIPYATFGFTVNDGDANSTSAYTATINVTAVDDAPTLTAIPNVIEMEDASDFNITLTATDTEGDTITYIATSSNPAIASVAIVDGKLVVTPIANASGVVNVEVNATANGQTTTQTFELELTAVNDTPSIDTTFANITVDEDSGVRSYDLNVSDIDGDDLNVTITSSDESLISVQPNWSGLLNQAAYSQGLDFNITMQPNANGSASIAITVEDAQESVTRNFNVVVTAVNDAPTLATISNVIVYKDSLENNISLEATDAENDVITYSAVAEDPSLFESITFTNNVMQVSLNGTTSGNSDINVTVSDGDLNSSKVFNFYILPLEDGEDVEHVGDINQTSDENTTTITITIDNNLSVETQEDTNGTVTHKIVVNDKEITATSDVNGSVVEFTADGVKTTYSDENVSVEVDATLDGKATHIFDVGGVVTEAVSEFVGAVTNLAKDVNNALFIETSVQVDANTSISVIAKEDGTAEHVVSHNGKTSKVVSALAGAFTKITTNGSVETRAGNTPSDEAGYTIKAKVVTDENGNSKTSFVRVNDNDPTDEVALGNTLKSTASFEAGNSVAVQEIEGKLYMKIETPLSDVNLEIE